MAHPTSRDEVIADEDAAFNRFLHAQDAFDRDHEAGIANSDLQNALTLVQTTGRAWREAARIADRTDETVAAEEAAQGNAGAQAEFAAQRDIRRDLQTQRIVDRLEQLRLRTGGVTLIGNGYPEVETSATENLESTSLESTSTIEVSPAASTVDEGSETSHVNGVSWSSPEPPDTTEEGSVTRTESSGPVSASRLTTDQSESLMEVQQRFPSSEGSDNSYIAALEDGEADIEMEGENKSDA